MTEPRYFRLQAKEVVRLDEDGRAILVSSPSASRDALREMSEGQYRQAKQMRQGHRAKIDARRQSLAADPAVPPEKRPI